MQTKELTKKKKSRASKATLTRARIVADKRKFLKIYEQSMSVVAATVNLGIHRATFYKWCKADKAFQKKFLKIRTNKVQHIRDSLEAHIASGDLKATIFFLQHNAPEYARNLQLFPGGEWAEEAKEKKKLSADQRKMIRVALKNVFDEQANTIPKKITSPTTGD